MESALGAIRHRGPDAQGVWHAPGDGPTLGFVRLAIIDLTARANQPMVCPRTGNALVFNGEIYNFRALKAELQRLGWEFTTTSDTEVLLAAYGEWGQDCLSRLNGMFAFTIYDPAKKQILMARDRVGKKPLYYTLWQRELAWASEIKALLQLRGDLPRTIDTHALKAFLDIGYIPGELSIYKQIRKLPPAHCAVYSLEARELNVRRYWSLPQPDDSPVNDDAAAEELEELLRDAVRLRLESDVPVGTLLSGGLDSGLITAMTAKENPDIAAYTAQFPVAKYDETAVATRVAEWVGVRHVVVPVGAEDRHLLESLAVEFDEPFDDSSLLPTFLVCQAIRTNITVALSGDGGDELFAGYPPYEMVLQEQKWERIPRAVRAAASPLHHLMPVGARGKNFLRRLPQSCVERFRMLSVSPDHLEISPLKAEAAARIRGLEIDAYRHAIQKQLEAEASHNPAMTPLQQLTRLDFRSFLPDDIMVKVDRASMFTSLEARAPILDYRVVEFAYRLPDRLRFDGTTKKVLLKRVARKYLPPDFPYDHKQGFSIPEAEWFQHELGTFLEQLLERPSALLDRSNVLQILALHRRTPRFGRTLFKTLMLALFERCYGGVLE
jgi:asparagine synthase (glutamine-hydrolysing)